MPDPEKGIFGWVRPLFRFGGLGTAPTVAHSDIVTSSLPTLDLRYAPILVTGTGITAGLGQVGGVKAQESLLGAPAASVSFSTLPSTGYRTARIVWQARGTNASEDVAVNVQFNADTGNNYDCETYQFAGTTTAGIGISEVGNTSSMRLGTCAAGTATANYASSGQITIPNFAGTTFVKSCFATVAHEISTTTGKIRFEVDQGLWHATPAAVSSILVFPAAGNFATGSLFTLYLDP